MLDNSSKDRQNLVFSVKRVLWLQSISTAGVVVVVLLYGIKYQDVVLVDSLLGAIFGCSLAIIGTLINSGSVRRVSRSAMTDSQAAVIPILLGLLSKMVIVGGGIAFGLVFLEFNPVLLVTCYVLVQFSPVLTMLRRRS